MFRLASWKSLSAFVALVAVITAVTTLITVRPTGAQGEAIQMAVDMDPTTPATIDSTATISTTTNFSVGINVTAATSGYQGYQVELQFPNAGLDFGGSSAVTAGSPFQLCQTPNDIISGDTTTEFVQDGCAKSSAGTVMFVGQLETIQLKCVSSGTFTIHMTTLTEDAFFGTAALDASSSAVPTGTTDATVTCALGGGATSTPTTAAATATTAASTSTNTPVATSTNTPAATNTTAPTSTNTSVPTSTNTPAATNTPVPGATETNTPAPTDTPVPGATETNTAVPTDTNTPAPTDTPVPGATETDTAVPADTNTPAPTDTSVPGATETNTAVPTDTNTPAPTDTSVPGATNTTVPSATNTSQPAATNTATNTPPPATATATPTPGQCVPLGQKISVIIGIIFRLGVTSGDNKFNARYDLNHNDVIDAGDLQIALDLQVCHGSLTAITTVLTTKPRI